MKSKYLFLVAALGMISVACDDTTKTEPAPPQNYPAPPIVSDGAVVSSTAGILKMTNINLNDYADTQHEEEGILVDGTLLEAIVLEETKDLPEGAQVVYTIELSANEDFDDDYQTVPTIAEGNKYYINTEAWNDAHVWLYGSAQEERLIYYRVPVYVVVSGTTYRYNSPDYYAAEGDILEMCIESKGLPGVDFLYTPGANGTWNFENDLKVFNIETGSPTNTYSQFKGFVWIISEFKLSSIAEWEDDKNWGLYPDEEPEIQDDGALAGKLQAGAGNIPVPEESLYLVEANMADLQYRLYTINTISCRGAFNGWGDGSAPDALLTPSENHFIWTTEIDFTEPNSEFKINTNGSWNYPQLGGDPSALDLGGNTDNIVGPAEPGRYLISLSFEQWPYTLTWSNITLWEENVGEYAAFYLRGGMNNWGNDWFNDEEPAPAAKDWEFQTGEAINTYVINNVTIPAGTEFKVADSKWSNVNYGGGVVEPGTVTALVYNGDNLKVDNAFTGSVTVTFNGPMEDQPSCTILLTPAN
ncbi:MAG: hypothetical protein J1F16_04100 [Muribaculaceae bacterium]|nr:hypothetical protein [Muribaculaceae bacterium]